MAGNRRTDWDDGYAYRRRYLDETAWEPVEVSTVRRALGDAYRDVSLALDFLPEAGSIRTPAAEKEVIAMSPSRLELGPVHTNSAEMLSSPH